MNLIITVMFEDRTFEVYTVRTRVKTERGRQRSIEYWMDRASSYYPEYHTISAAWEDRA